MEGFMERIGELWGSLRGILRNHPTFAQIKDLVGAAGLPVQELSHIQQKQSGGASKGQLMDEIDGLVNKLDYEQCDQFVATCTKELLGRYGHLRDEVETVFRKHGWGINDAYEIIHFKSNDSQVTDKIKVPTEIKPKKVRGPLFNPLEWYHRLNIREKIVVAIIGLLGVCVLAGSNIISAHIQSSTSSRGRISPLQFTQGSTESGDIVGRDKLIFHIPPVSKTEDIKTQIKVAKVKINRIIEDLSAILEETRKEYLKESDKVASNFNSRNMFTSGVFVKAQKELAINTREKIEKIFIKAHRDIQDITLENFEAINLDEMPEFAEEKQALLEIEQDKAHKIYILFENVVKSWEMKALGTTELTKDFKL
jgi:hypothetical protein